MFTEEEVDPKKALEIDLSKKMEQLQTEQLAKAIKKVPRLSVEELRNRFEWHQPKDKNTATAHSLVRNACLDLAITLNNVVPEGREKALMMTHLEEVMMWANAGIARNS